VFFLSFFPIAPPHTAGAFILYMVDDNGDNEVSDNVVPLRFVFALLPPVMFFKCITDIAAFALRGQGLTLSLASKYTSVFPITTCWAYVCLFYCAIAPPPRFGASFFLCRPVADPRRVLTLTFVVVFCFLCMCFILFPLAHLAVAPQVDGVDKRRGDGVRRLP